MDHPSNLVGAWILLATCLCVRVEAADWTWDCNAAADYQPCNGSIEEQKFTNNGTDLVFWPGGSAGMVLAGASGTYDINVVGTHGLGQLIVSSAGYTLFGSGMIELASSPTIIRTDADVVVSTRLGGDSGLTKNGVGILTLSGANTYKGATTVNAGAIKVGSDSALGDTAGGTVVATGGTLDIDGHSLGMEAVELAGGSIVNSGDGQKNGLQRLVVSANSSIGGTTSWDIRAGAYPSPGIAVNGGTTLTKIGASNISIAKVPITNNGTIEVREGKVVFNEGLEFAGTGAFVVDSGGGLLVTSDSTRILVPNPVRMTSGTLECYNGYSETEFSGAITFSGAFRNVINTTTKLLLTGVIGGTGRLSKWSPGIVVLSNDNTYSGIVGLESGELHIGNGGASGSLPADTIRDNAILVYDHTGTKTFAGAISGTGTLTRRGSGTDIFTGDLTHVGGTAISAGTLQIGNGGATGSITGNIANSGSLVFDRSLPALHHGDTISGTGALIKKGSGVLALGGRNTYTGATTVSAGKLVVTGSLGNTSVTVGSGASLGGTGSIAGTVAISSGGMLDPGEYGTTGNLRVGALTTSTGSVLSFRVGKDSNLVIVAGNLSLGGTIDIEAGSGIGEGIYTLFTCTGTLASNTAVVGSTPAGYKATLGTTGNAVTVTLDLDDANLFWDCDSASGIQPCDGAWTDAKFTPDSVHLVPWPGAGNRAIFAGADGGYTITNAAEALVDSLVFMNTGYVLSGGDISLAKGVRVASGKSDTIDNAVLTGPGITLDGGGTLVLRNSDNQRFGFLTIASGTFVALRNGGTTGNKLGTGNVTIANGATLVMKGLLQGDSCSNPMFLSGSGSGKGGLLLEENYYGVNLNSPIILQADATIGSDTYGGSKPASLGGTIGGPYDLTLSSYRGVLRSTGIISIGGDLTTNQTDTVMLYKKNTYTGNTVVGSGTLRLGGDAAIPDGTGKGNVAVTGALDMNGFDDAVNGLSGSGTIDNASADTSTLTIGNNDQTSTFRGSIRSSVGRLNLVKIGSGTLVLAGANPFQGTTKVNGGVLRVDGSCDSSAVTVNTGAILEGNGTLAAIVVSSGVVRPGSADSIGVLSGASADFSGGSNSSLSIRAIGATKPGIQYDRLKLAGALVLGGTSAVNLDLSGFAEPGTMTGVVQAGSVSGTFSRVNLRNAARLAVRLVYRESSVDAVVEAVPYVSAIDTTLPASADSVTLSVGNSVTVTVPPHGNPRRVAITIDDTTLRHGIAGADTAIVLSSGTIGAGPVVIRAPVDLVPLAERAVHEIPAVFRLDSLGKVHVVPSTLRSDSAMEFVALDDGAFWLGYDTVPPTISASFSKDSIALGDSTSVSYSLRDNVVETGAYMCLLRAGQATAVCSLLVGGDSVEGEQFLSRSSIPLGAWVWMEGRDTRSTARSESRDVVVAIDTLRAGTSRQEDAYELVATPYASGRGSAHAAFQAQWGADDPRRWRAYRFDSTVFSEVVGDDTTSALGRAFWVRSRKTERSSWMAGGWTWPVSVPVPIRLAPGWNMVGNPLGFDVDWRQVRKLSGLDTLDVSGPYDFDGASQNWSMPDSTTVMPAWKGLAFLNSTGRAITLRISSIASGAFAPRPTANPAPLRISLKGSQGTQSTTRVWVGIDPSLRLGGCRNHPMPPSPGSSLKVFLPPPRGARATGPFLTDIRSSEDSTQVWTILVKGLVADDPLILDLERFGTDTASVSIHDDKANRWLPIAARMDFAVGSESSRSFKIMVGGNAAMLNSVGRLGVSARGRSLRWCIPEEMGRTRVRIEMRDPSGRMNGLLVDETMDPGSYDRDIGIFAPSGPRLIILRAGGRVQSSYFGLLR